ncbi:MAG: ribosome biogenesis GTPase Der [Vampirovibrionales bacterium]
MTSSSSSSYAKKPVVAIVGRPNVGKSTFVNRLVGGRRAIVDDQPGVTRDRAYYETDWCGHDFWVVDTGGLIPDSEEAFDPLIRVQVQYALDEADVVVFLVDGRDGLMPADRIIAQGLRKLAHQKPVVLGVNKIDSPELMADVYEFSAMGFKCEPIAVSAQHGFGGVGNLLDAIVAHFPQAQDKQGSVAEESAFNTYYEEDEDSLQELDALDLEDEGEHEELSAQETTLVTEASIPKIALVGRPNVGKSSIFNALVGHPRVIVSDIAGTTRDTILTRLVQDDWTYDILDTAGIRRKGKVDYGIEWFSVDRSLSAMEQADVVLLVLDAVDGVTDQDKTLAELINRKGRGLVVVVNKWDCVDNKHTNSMAEMEKTYRQQLPHIGYAPFVFVSAASGQRLQRILPTVGQVMRNTRRRISTSVINQVFREALSLNPPPPVKNKVLNILYATQAAVAPPTFVLFVNYAKCLKPDYRRYLERKLRDNIELEGCPLRILVRERLKTPKLGGGKKRTTA